MRCELVTLTFYRLTSKPYSAVVCVRKFARLLYTRYAKLLPSLSDCMGKGQKAYFSFSGLLPVFKIWHKKAVQHFSSPVIPEGNRVGK